MSVQSAATDSAATYVGLRSDVSSHGPITAARKAAGYVSLCFDHLAQSASRYLQAHRPVLPALSANVYTQTRLSPRHQH